MADTDASWMRRMFDGASGKYVSVNRLITFGMDEAWRGRAVKTITAKNGDRILDICTGTGDLALKIAARFPDNTIYGLDYSPEMLRVARERAGALKCGNLTFSEGNCTKMPFEDGYFDYVTVSFGFRNLSYSSDIFNAALKEVRRVLNSDGRFIIVETSQPSSRLVRELFHFYALKIVPLAGALFAGQKEPYSYLGRSMAKFYSKSELINLLKGSGFKEDCSFPFMFGAVLLSVFKKAD